jgi:3-oxoacyl-[acyl-carrier protein] reductase
MKLLETKTAIITGASRGIGEAIAIRYAEQGCNVAFTYLSSADRALALEQKLNNMGIKAKGYKSNAAVLAEAEALVKNVITDFGNVHVLINNAGVTRDTLLMKMNEQQWDDVINNNLKSVFNLTKQLIMPMMKQRCGSIINMTSIVGMRGNAGQSNYAASKAGIIGFTKSIAQEYGSRNIRCNAVAPGFIDTDMTKAIDTNVTAEWLKKIPLARFGQPEEVADTCVFLGSHMSGYISGQVLSVCGAMNC